MLDLLMRWIAEQSAGFWTAVMTLVPAPPQAVVSACGVIGDAVGMVQPLAWLVPLGAAGAASLILVTGIVAGFVIMLIRIVVSFGTLGGGGS